MHEATLSLGDINNWSSGLEVGHKADDLPSNKIINSFICMSKILYKFRGTGYRLLSIISIKYMNISIIKRVKTYVTITIKLKN
jgi:hypothetical protein